MINLSVVKWASFFVADEILFILLGASRLLPVPTEDATTVPSPPIFIVEPLTPDAPRAMDSYYFYGALFISPCVALLLINYLRSRTAKEIVVTESR